AAHGHNDRLPLKPQHPRLGQHRSFQSSIQFNTGAATALNKNVLFYGYFGIIVFENSYTEFSDFLLDASKKFDVRFGCGSYYILPKGFTSQVSLDITEFEVILGLGYTF
ncbi:MAG: hypothetical protein SNJ71_08475, partial [Bacteroidales bacterium]